MPADPPRKPSHFMYGVAYYPEHWDADIRRTDPFRLKYAGFNVVRMGEFAWNYFEPTEGLFQFELFDEAIAAMAAQGIKTILCTPTAAPPCWLSDQHPEILRVDANGVSQQHGSRQHASHFSQVFRHYSRTITSALAEHYADNPDVIGWQTDNEFHCHFAEDYSPAAHEAWCQFLADRYDDDIHRLNQAWGTAFWAQSYSDFARIPLPRETRPTHHNPAQMLDYHRFLSDGVTLFQRDQVEILRSANPAWFVTHNGCFRSIDYFGEFCEDLDFLSYDSYPFFDPDPAKRRFSHAFNLDWVRAYSGNFVIMEQQAGPGGQGNYLHDTPEPGEMRRMAWSGIARGADGLLFFRERSCRFGAEEYWCGILDHDNIPRRRYHEACSLGSELLRLGDRIVGSTVHCDIAIAGADFVSQYGHQALSNGLPSPRAAAERIHNYFEKSGYAVGCAHPSLPPATAKIFFIPHLAICDARWVESWESWVESGGIMVVGARSACKDLHNNVNSETLPGILRPLCGIRVEDYGRQNNSPARPLTIRVAAGSSLTSSTWYEQLVVEDADTEVIAFWSSRHLKDTPAATARKLGKGYVLYIGTWLTDNVLSALESWLSSKKLLPIPHKAPEGIEVVTRINAQGDILRFFINHNEYSVTVHSPLIDLVSGKSMQDGLTLAANDVAIATNLGT